MKVWGIIATILLIGALGFGGWLYMQNKNLKDQKAKVEADLSAANKAKAESDTKKTAASTKLAVVVKMMAGINTQAESFAVYDLIKPLNDPTLSADWQAMQNSQPGDNIGNKLLTDLIASATNDLK